MKHDTTKVYAQLCPDLAGVDELLAIKNLSKLPCDGWVESEELHMTLIHFGKTETMFQAIASQTEVKRARFDAALEVLVNRFDQELRSYDVLLAFRDLALFGQAHKTLVARFYPSDELIAKHATLYGYVEEFLRDCGIENPQWFSRRNRALQYSHELAPHVTLCKSFTGAVPSPTLHPIYFQAMPIEYSH